MMDQLTTGVQDPATRSALKKLREASATTKVNRAGDTMTDELVISNGSAWRHLKLVRGSVESQLTVSNVAGLGLAIGKETDVHMYVGPDETRVLSGFMSAPSLRLGADPPGIQSYLRVGQISSATNGITTETNSTAARVAAAFRNPNGNVGSIITSASSTAFNTSSDVRLKKSLGELSGALDVIRDITIHVFQWLTDDTQGVGPMAQELYEVVPSAVTVGGDDPREAPWQVDLSKLVPLVVSAIQELDERVAAIEAHLVSVETI